MMTEDLPMFDAYTADDAEMADDGEYDYEMQEEPAPSGNGTAPLQEYDMAREDQADYEDVIVAEPIVVTPIVDVPIIQEAQTVTLVEENTQLPQPEILEITPTIVQSEEPNPSADASFDVIPITAPEPVILPPLESAPQIPMSTQTDLSATTDPSPMIKLLDLPEDTTVTIPPTESLSTTIPSPPVETHVAVQHDVPSQSEPTTLPAESQEATPTLAVPPIALYFEDKVFSLFHDNESGSSVLLAGREDLYTSPLAQLLREIKVQEHVLFPGIEDCVLGLEYQELDLCIDQNCRYAELYTLGDLSNALLACNHTSIEFNIFQITDFEQSLLERAKGNLPAPVVIGQTGETAHDEGQINFAVATIGTPTQEQATNVGTGSHTFGHTEGATAAEEPDTKEGGHEVHDDTAAVAVQAPDAIVIPEAHRAEEGTETTGEDPSATEQQLEQLEETAEHDELHHEAEPAKDTEEPQHAEPPSHQAQTLPPTEVVTDNLPEPSDDVAEISSISSATLESSNHDADQQVLPKEGEAEAEAAQVGDNGEGSHEAGEEGDSAEYSEEQEEHDYDAEEPDQHHEADLEHSVAETNGTEVADEVPLQNNASSDYLPSLDGEGEEEAEEIDSADAVDPVAQSVLSSPLTEEEEFGEYDNEEGLDDDPNSGSSLTTVVDIDTAVPQIVVTALGVKEGTTSPPAAIVRKRSLEDVDPDDTSEYNDADDYGVDSKRARVA
ncbi:hypothetical protein FRB96_007569 [Tulasnella sp. 330]|nr:hypothetical protein FRB96_007569 [Tulasnella sp. 330]KAG8871743.1 hypothetical protein FRB97_008330 [Tulasnella sp. 331]